MQSIAEPAVVSIAEGAGGRPQTRRQVLARNFAGNESVTSEGPKACHVIARAEGPGYHATKNRKPCKGDTSSRIIAQPTIDRLADALPEFRPYRPGNYFGIDSRGFTPGYLIAGLQPEGVRPRAGLKNQTISCMIPSSPTRTFVLHH